MTTYRQDVTFASCSTPFTPAANATDIFTIQGNATTNVYVLKMGISTVQGADGFNQWFLIKRSAANTAAGTFTSPAKVNYNSKNAAANAVVSQFSANPTPGAAVGTVWSGYVYAPVVTDAGSSNDIFEVDFRDMFGEPLTLLSANEILALNFNGAAIPAGLTVIAYFVWTEGSKT